jgi:hypothetical protein
MKKLSFLMIVLLEVILGASLRGAAQVRPPLAGNLSQVSFGVAVEHPEFRGDFVNLLLAVARTYRIPLIAELSEPLPKDITIPSGTHNASQILDILMQTVHGYSWQQVGAVARIYQADLATAPGNFLNYKVKKFQFPQTVSDLKLILPNILSSVTQSTPGSGGVVTGFRSKELSGDKLPPKVLRNTTGREILLQAANLSPHFAAVIVFPSPHPKRQGQSDRDYATRNWFWASLSSPTQLPVRVQ